MAGRPRLYADAAEKTRAYRERKGALTIAADRQWFEQSIKDMRRLACAVIDAQKRGDPLALSLRVAMAPEMMEDLAHYFESGILNPPQSKSRRK